MTADTVSGLGCAPVWRRRLLTAAKIALLLVLMLGRTEGPYPGKALSASLNNIPAQSQIDPKALWPDGSVRHAVVRIPGPAPALRVAYVSDNKWTPDDSRQPSLSYPYLLTGSQFYRDELAKQAGYVLLASGPAYRGGGYAALTRGALARLLNVDPSPEVAAAYDSVHEPIRAMTANYAQDPTFAIAPPARMRHASRTEPAGIAGSTVG
ncbi:MAG TPA: hypothetical protein VFS01_08280 [Rhizomicrobium sp.]|nr:hypothetical protein [Rhizomicrobium sp.]